MPKVTICIPAYNAEKTIIETLLGCVAQKGDYDILVSDNNSTDRTLKAVEIISKMYPGKITVINEPRQGQGYNMDNCVIHATGDYLIFLCSDDVFINSNVVEEYKRIFNTYPNVGHISRYYYQFINGPVRYHKTDNIYHLANNISGLGFRKDAISGNFSNDYWIEAASMVKNVLSNWEYFIVPKYLVGVRTGETNCSSSKAPYIKSPMMAWYKLIGPYNFVIKNFCSLVQIRCRGTYWQYLREIYYFVKVHPWNLLDLRLWFYLFVTHLPKRLIIFLNNYYKSSQKTGGTI